MRCRQLAIGLLAGSILGLAQQPNCQINFGPWTDTNTSPAFNNIGAGTNNQCTYWVLNYQVDGFSAISLAFESATGAVTTGVNPSTSVVCSTVANCTAVFTGTIGWYRVNFATHTGSGTIRGTLKGYITGYSLGGNSPSGGGCAGTTATPCVVDGVTAAGSAPATSPVLVAGIDGTNVRTLRTDTTGRQVAVGAAAAGVALAGAPVLQGLSDGANAQNAFLCPLQAAVTIAAGTDVVIAAGAMGKKTIVCHLDFVSTAVATFTLQQGTTVMTPCDTTTAPISGAYPSILSFAADYQPTAALRTTVNANDLCLHSSATVTVGGFITYAQF